MSSSIRGLFGDETWAAAPRRRRRRRAEIVAIAAAIGLHGAIAAGLLVVGPPRLPRPDPVVEMEVKERPLPPPEIRPEPPPPAAHQPEPAPRPRIVQRHIASTPKPTPAPPAPPPPNQEPPPKPAEAPPVFGVTMSSVIAGDNTGMAVPVGNSLMTKRRGSEGKPGVAPAAYGAAGTEPFTPVADIYIAQRPAVLHEVNSADIYPPEAQKMGIEGTVELKVDLDENGAVVRVRVIGRAGHGFDEAARDALRRFKFSPARTSDGKAVKYSLTYKYSFDMSH
jgi:protein TonB